MRDLLERHEILNSASAIAFQVLFALVPLALFTLALLGFLDLERVWEDAAAEIEPKVSGAAFEVIDDTARQVIDEEQPFWLTAGAALAMWRLSAAMRATMGALDRVYDEGEERSLRSSLKTSIALSLATTALGLCSPSRCSTSGRSRSRSRAPSWRRSRWSCAGRWRSRWA